MNDRMTSAVARARAEVIGRTTPGGKAWLRAADALEQYEREAEVRAGMPELLEPWRVIDRAGDEWASYTDKAEALSRAKRSVEVNDRRGPFTAVRLAVVEVAEPESVREVGPSGYQYGREGERLYQYRDGRLWNGPIRSSKANYIPPADTGLVARLLGEVG